MYRKLCKFGQCLVAFFLIFLLPFPAIKADSKRIGSADVVISQEDSMPPPNDDSPEHKGERNFSQEATDKPIGAEPQMEEEVESETEPIIQEVVEQETGSGDDKSEKKTDSESTEEKKSENEDPKSPVQEESFFQKCRKVASECYDVVSTFVTDNKTPCSIVGGIVTLYIIAFSIVTIIIVRHVRDHAKEYEIDLTTREITGELKTNAKDITFWMIFRHPFRAWKWFVEIDKIKRPDNYVFSNGDR